MAGSARSYRSPLRESQAKDTRRRIIDATLRVLGNSASSFTVPAVAKEANVSLPTVYRLFPNKEALENGARQAVRERLGVEPLPPKSMDELESRQRLHILRLAEADEAFQRAQIILNARQLPHAERDKRTEWFTEVLAKELKGVRGKQRRYAVNMIGMLCSSAGGAALWRFGLLTPEGADSICWAIRTLAQGAKASSPRAGSD